MELEQTIARQAELTSGLERRPDLNGTRPPRVMVWGTPRHVSSLPGLFLPLSMPLFTLPCPPGFPALQASLQRAAMKPPSSCDHLADRH
ncbi:MAG: hypothetical protein OXD45_13930 [Rhodobacteraceae bacterium]|nr:hypothetical protein [Paracoccaceae bacterium]MCY4186396.1 hypothetical protein [Paracoccaceae bacterium]